LSTILKALKRIDQTAPPPEKIQSWPWQIDAKETVKTRLKKLRHHRNVYLALAFALICAAAGWFLISQNPLILKQIFSDSSSENSKLASRPPSSNKDPGFNSKSRQPSPASVDLSEKPSSLTSKKRTPIPVIKKGLKTTKPDRSSAPISKTPSRNRLAKKPTHYASNAQEKPVRTNPLKSMTPQPNAADPKKTLRPNPNALPPSANKKTPSPAEGNSSYHSRLDDSKLKLQAIAWSNDAAQRIAVINGSIIREGGSVDGFSVTRIRQNDVIVNDGTKSWRLEFGLK
jgi:hypothetical protein